ncbi:CitB family two-component system response regulator CitT [Salibacterium salarium]|uniref:response regulator n=1 Tax=Salibacterium salarium TaxID=284579 RepID=UPI00278016FC|nr:response regulator [Salibacterium salarium]MDQ0300747.1 CitB family two-component system response regulator CitT [Salibacterium salarium]
MINVGIAEDDFRIASIHQELVNRVGDFTCKHQALNASETMTMLEQQPIDLLLLDIYMPDALGTNLLSNIRETFPSVDIVIISASTDTEHVQKSLRYGVFDYIIKPVSLKRLEKTLQEYQLFQKQLNETNEMTQDHIDKLTSFRSPSGDTVSSNGDELDQLPKGIDSLTLQTVRQELEKTEDGVTAEEMGKYLGASRTTARRYLEFLISKNQAEAKPIYGIVGRPERKYFNT